jgi:hypothetical protein
VACTFSIESRKPGDESIHGLEELVARTKCRKRASLLHDVSTPLVEQRRRDTDQHHHADERDQRNVWHAARLTSP